jgi:hypothetical protein
MACSTTRRATETKSRSPGFFLLARLGMRRLSHGRRPAQRGPDFQTNPLPGILTIGILGAIWSSSAAVVAIIGSLNRAYDIEEGRPWWNGMSQVSLLLERENQRLITKTLVPTAENTRLRGLPDPEQLAVAELRALEQRCSQVLMPPLTRHRPRR